MRIEQYIFKSTALVKSENNDMSFQKGMTFAARVLSFSKGIMNIKLPQGMVIRAFAEEGINLPADTNVTFEVLENKDGILILKPVFYETEAQSPIGTKEEIIIGFLNDIGLKPTPENIKFINEQGFIFSENMEKAAASGSTGDIQKYIMLNPNELSKYITEFEESDGEEFLKRLKLLVSEGGKSGKPSKAFSENVSKLLKGLIIQANRHYPVCWIPIPLYFNGQACYGEIMITAEEDEKKKQAYAYIFADTPSGRIEAEVKNYQKYIDINIYCKDELIPYVNKHTDELRSSISGAGFILKAVSVQELKRKRNFMDIVQGYVKPFKPIDVRV